MSAGERMGESPPHIPQATVAGSPLSGIATRVAAELLEQNKMGETVGENVTGVDTLIFFIIVVLLLLSLFAYIYISVHHVSSWYPQRPGIGSPGTGLTDGCEVSCGC